ncbi:putative reverse transcriptase domain-containing protein [Tanacetum coccineum]
MIAIRMKKFYKKTRRRVWIDGNKPVGFDKKKLECFKCHNTSHFARECTSKGTNEGKKRDSFYQDQGTGMKESFTSLTGDYTPNPQEEIDDSLYVYGKKGPQNPKTSVLDDKFSENSVTSSEEVVSDPKPKEAEPSYVTHVKTPSLSHLIRDCDFYEKKMEREAELKQQRVFNTGNGVAKLVWNNAHRVNHANHFLPRPIPLNAVRQNVNFVRPNVNTGRANVNSVKSNVNSVRHNVNSITPRVLGQFSSMSNSEDSTVTYTEISSPFEDLSDIGSPGAEGTIFQDPPSTNYVPGPEEPEKAPPSSIYVPFVPKLVYPEFLPEDDVLPAEEQPLPVAASPTTESPRYIPESDPEEDPEEDDEEDPKEDPADYPADRGDDRDDEEPSDDDDDDDDDAEEEEHLAPADPAAVAYSADQDPYLAYRVTARMSIRPQAPAPFLSEEVAERLLALPTPPPSPLSPYSSPLPQIPSPPLPIPSPPPNSPTYVEGSLGSRAAGIRQRDALPSPVHETEMPEICLPLRKRPCRTTPGPGYEVGESSAAGTARQVGPATARADLYGFADMLDAAPGRQTSRELGYGITDTWDDLVGAIQEIAPTTLEGVNQRVTELATTVDQEDEIIYSQLDDARHDRALLRARVNMLYRDRPFHRRTALLMEEEARVSRAAWAQSMDACDQVRSEGISLRTTVMAQQSEITELQAADRRRQTVISDLLKADHRRQRQLVEALKIVKSLKTQMIELQRQQGPAKDPAEPELPEEASSSS